MVLFKLQLLPISLGQYLCLPRLPSRFPEMEEINIYSSELQHFCGAFFTLCWVLSDNFTLPHLHQKEE